MHASVVGLLCVVALSCWGDGHGALGAIQLQDHCTGVRDVRGNFILTNTRLFLLNGTDGSSPQVAKTRLLLPFVLLGNPSIDYNPSLPGYVFLPMTKATASQPPALDSSNVIQQVSLTDLETVRTYPLPPGVTPSNVYVRPSSLELVVWDNVHGQVLLVDMSGSKTNLFVNKDIQTKSFRYRGGADPFIHAATVNGTSLTLLTLSPQNFSTVSATPIPLPPSASDVRVHTLVSCPKGAPTGQRHIYIFYDYTHTEGASTTRSLDMVILSNTAVPRPSILPGTPFSVVAERASTLTMAYDFAATGIAPDVLGIVLNKCTQPRTCTTVVAGVDVVQHKLAFQHPPLDVGFVVSPVVTGQPRFDHFHRGSAPPLLIGAGVNASGWAVATICTA